MRPRDLKHSGELRAVRPDEQPTSNESGSERHGVLAEGIPLGRLVPRALKRSPELPVLAEPRSIAAEKFRRLKTRLAGEYGTSVRVLVVTSPAPNEGKSVVAANLALAFAEDSVPTLLVDVDLRRPSIHRWLSPAPAVGLSEILQGKADIDHGLIAVKDTSLTVLPGGQAIQEPGGLLASEAFPYIIAELRERFGRVVIDTPPVVPFSDADIIASAADGVLLVSRSGRTLRSAFKKAISLLTARRILGVVVNDTVAGIADHDHRHDRYYDDYYKKPKEGR